jgi:uncharacterized membrane-anchored protein
VREAGHYDPGGGQPGDPSGTFKRCPASLGDIAGQIAGRAMETESDDVTISRIIETPAPRRAPQRLVGARRAVAKVPEITVYFWITKLLTTAMGEAASDYLAHRLNPIVAGAIGFTAFALALALQFRARRYVAWVYWLAVAMVAVFGTMAADGLHVELGIPYTISTTLFVVGLIVVFGAWYAMEKTLSIHSITTPRRELFYWAAVMATFALGTAAGDFTAITLHLGFLASAGLFAGLILVPAVAYWVFHVNEVLAFWCAYVLTRPLGASIADYLGVSHARGGIGWGTAQVSIGLAILIAALVAYLSVTRKDIQAEPAVEAR